MELFYFLVNLCDICIRHLHLHKARRNTYWIISSREGGDESCYQSISYFHLWPYRFSANIRRIYFINSFCPWTHRKCQVVVFLVLLLISLILDTSYGICTYHICSNSSNHQRKKKNMEHHIAILFHSCNIAFGIISIILTSYSIKSSYLFNILLSINIVLWITCRLSFLLIPNCICLEEKSL